jgi:hypothetical protein
MVGSAGLEPTTPRSSDECSHPVSYEPAEDGGVEPHGLSTATSFQGPVPRRRRIFPVRRATDSNRSACAPIRFRGGACEPGRFTLQSAAREIRTHTAEGLDLVPPAEVGLERHASG